MSQKVLKINEVDNVIVALQDIAKGTTVSYNDRHILIVDDIPS